MCVYFKSRFHSCNHQNSFFLFYFPHIKSSTVLFVCQIHSLNSQTLSWILKARMGSIFSIPFYIYFPIFLLYHASLQVLVNVCAQNWVNPLIKIFLQLIIAPFWLSSHILKLSERVVRSSITDFLESYSFLNFNHQSLFHSDGVLKPLNSGSNPDVIHLSSWQTKYSMLWSVDSIRLRQKSAAVFPRWLHWKRFSWQNI